MSEQIILALLSFAGTLIGTLAGIFATSRLSNYRIEQLEKKGLFVNSWGKPEKGMI